MEPNSEQLKELVQSSIDSIETHIESVEKLPLEEEYKNELTLVLRKIHDSILAAKPILSHLDQVKGLVINPIQEGVDKAFNESNKWGILGLKVSIISLIVTVSFGIFGSKIPGFKNFLGLNNTLSLVQDDGGCKTPKITRILKSFELQNNNTFYISGECFKTNNVQFSGINLHAKRISDALLMIENKDLVKTDKGNILSVLNYSTRFDDNSETITTPSRIDLDSMTIHGGQQLKGNQLVDYRASYGFDINAPQLEAIWEYNTPVHIGGSLKYFGKGLKPKDEFTVTYTIKNRSESNQYFMLIKAVGIGPGVDDKKNEKYTAMTTLKVNSGVYTLDKYWPFWGDLNAKKKSATFIVPIKEKDLQEGENTLQLIAGRYKDNEGSIYFDNSLFQSILLMKVVEKNHLTSP